MNLTKEDYMRLPKERLAELLVERDNECFISIEPTKQTPMPTTPSVWRCDDTMCHISKLLPEQD